jgi:DnaJ-domain-containing protein 1
VDEARAAARRLRSSLSESHLTQIRSVFRAASATADLSDAASSKVLKWLRGEPTEGYSAEAPSGAVTRAALVLGLPPQAGLHEAKRAYRTLAAQFHPDTTAGLTEQQRAESAEAFRRVQEAYETYLAFMQDDAGRSGSGR